MKNKKQKTFCRASSRFISPLEMNPEAVVHVAKNLVKGHSQEFT